VAQQRHEADNSPPCSDKVKNGVAISPLHNTSSWCGASLIKPRDNFTFLLCQYKEQDNKTVSCAFKHTTLTKLSFRAGNIFSTLCNKILGCLSARCCIIFCKPETRSAHMVVCGLC
jgi:hypothetical protein